MKKPAVVRPFLQSESVKTTIVLPRGLWRRARIRAAETDKDLQTVIRDALALVLSTTGQTRA